MKQAQIKTLLPFVFQRTGRPGNPLDAILELMELLHAPSEASLNDLDRFFDPRRAPDKFVAYVATWVDLGMLLDTSGLGQRTSAIAPSVGVGRLRELTASAATLSRWRGTRKGLLLFLEIATGSKEFVIDEQVIEDGCLKPFHVRITAPARLEDQRALIRRIIELEKPAYVTYELEFKS